MWGEGGFKHLCCLQNGFLFPAPLLKATEITGRGWGQVGICSEALSIHGTMCDHPARSWGGEGHCNSGGPCSHFSMLWWWSPALTGTLTFLVVGKNTGKAQEGFFFLENIAWNVWFLLKSRAAACFMGRGVK